MCLAPFLSQGVQVQAFLQSESVCGLEQGDASELAGTIGGHLKDLRRVTQAIRHSQEHGVDDSWRWVYQTLLTDGRLTVVQAWQSIIDEGGSTSRSKSTRVAAYKRGLRFWKLAEKLASEEKVELMELSAGVFRATGGATAKEIDVLLANGLLSYTHGPSPGEVGVWITAGSPRLLAGFRHLVSDSSCLAYKHHAELELAKHEQTSRIQQLAQRRNEQALEMRALALLDSGGEAMDRLELERQDTVKELLAVRSEYDAMKWKGRWKTR